MATVIDIVREYIKANGFDGLVNVDAECGCLLDDMQPCGQICDDCEPGYRGVCPDKSFGDWYIYQSKQAAIDSVLARIDDTEDNT